MDNQTERGKTCCFIGHRKIIATEKLTTKLKSVLENLIIEHGVREFLFGSKSQFDDLCLEVVSELKESFPNIKRIYVRAEYPNIDDFYRNFLLKFYDDTYMPEKIENAGVASYVERNREIIDKSDFCVFYYDVNYRLSPRKSKTFGEILPKSGTKLAYEYAVNKTKAGKVIINLLDEL